MATEDPESLACRMAAFEWLQSQSLAHGDVVSLDLLRSSFSFNGRKLNLLGPKGIFKPSQIRHYPLSITTVAGGPYEDAFDKSGNLLLYKYRGTDPNFHDNRRLRDAMRDRIPLVYFHSTVPNRYMIVLPVFVVGDDPSGLTFTVAADDTLSLRYERDDEEPQIRRAYITRQVRYRIHQRTFRDRVLAAYRERCSICNLQHTSLLDAAHITADSEETGEPVVNNGLSLCKLHHAAFDQHMFAIKPSYEITVSKRILEESDGPMLLHGLQRIHGKEILLPSKSGDQPDRERLETRYRTFQNHSRDAEGATF